jgi:hypothetical protein
MNLPPERRLPLDDCANWAQAQPRLQAWLDAYVEDALRLRESDLLAADTDVDDIDQQLAAIRRECAHNVTHVMGNVRDMFEELARENVVRLLLTYLDAHPALWEVLKARLGPRRDAEFVAHTVLTLVAEHLGVDIRAMPGCHQRESGSRASPASAST